MSVELLARLQFTFTIAFHYIYPPLSIGLGVLLVMMEGMYLKTKNKMYERMTKFWVKVFALTFAMGVATGIVMEFEFGTNWATYSAPIGQPIPAMLAMYSEVLLQRRESSRSFSNPVFLPFSYSDGTKSPPKYISFLPAWSRSVQCSVQYGLLSPIRGCRHRQVFILWAKGWKRGLR